ncbi:6-hydroxy-D-nicotine oxidase [Xylariaceae sp. FL0662B]|nr:6-hydroxy-D-nicotine oxidase [Xylariaceae sp. FL0662B]
MKSLIFTLSAVVPTASALSLNVPLVFNMTSPSSTNDTNQLPPVVDVSCDILEAAGHKIYRSNTTAYAEREADYYSASARQSPSCIIQPTTSQEVANLIKKLVNGTNSNWAIRGGGHTAYGPAADIHNGVTIDLGLLNKTEYDAETKVAKVQGGSLWKDVYKTLEPYGVTVPGGRTSTVGVGGFTLGGGNNFYSGKVGFACDNVVNYEVVLASGEIVEANSKQNSDLFKALKGGSSNFGIVTRFDFQAFEVGDLYGGLVTYPLNATSKVISAFSNFVNNIENYQAGSAFSFWSLVQGAPESVVISALHDTTGTVDAPAYAEYKAIEHLSSTLRTDSHLNMTVELEFAKGFQNVWFAISVKNDPKILQFIVDKHNEFTASWKADTGDKTFSLYTVFQPLPKILFDHGVEKGGNVLGMDRETGNSVLFQVFMVFSGASLEPEARRRLVAYRESVKEQSIKTGTDVEFEYLNYADKTQSPLGTYGPDNVAFMRQVAAKYDPDHILEERMPGGAKIPKAN